MPSLNFHSYHYEINDPRKVVDWVIIIFFSIIFYRIKGIQNYRDKAPVRTS